MEGSGGRRIGARAKRTRMTTFRARGCRPVPRVPCTYLHVSAPALHGGGPVFELGILAVGALLVRDRLAQVGAHRSVTPCAFSCLVSAVAPAAKMSPAELTAERRSCLPRQPLRWVVARWNSHSRLSLPFQIQRNLTPSVACHTSAACGRRTLFVVDEVRIPSWRYSTAASTVKSFGRAVSHESRPDLSVRQDSSTVWR